MEEDREKELQRAEERLRARERESVAERERKSDREQSVAVLRCSCQVSEGLQKMAGGGGGQSVFFQGL